MAQVEMMAPEDGKESMTFTCSATVPRLGAVVAVVSGGGSSSGTTPLEEFQSPGERPQ